MGRYILGRLGQGVLALIILVTFVFVLVRFTGDPINQMLGPAATRAHREDLRSHLGLDKPIIVQYGIYWAQIVGGDFGKSLNIKLPVLQIIGGRLLNSARLAAMSMAVALLAGMPLGIIGAVKKDSAFDLLAKIIAVLGQALPVFWIGLVFIEIFSVRLKLLPVAGMGGISHYILPGVTMGWYVAAGIMRLLRSSMLDILDSEFVKMARAKGLSESTVILKHALKNALIPVVSFAGVYFSVLVTAAIVVETVFAWPGFGLMMYNALMFRDFPLIQGGVIITGVIVIVANLTVDILYAFIDPRIRYVKAR